MNKISSKENKIFNKNNLSNWIIGGVIALIIGKVMEPLFAYIFSIFINIGGSFITYISNSTYKKISNGYSEQSASSAFYLIYLVVFCIIGTTLGDAIREFSKFRKQEDFFNNSDTISTTTHPMLSKLPTQNMEKTKKQVSLSFFIIFSILSILLTSLILFYGRNAFILNKTIALTNNIEIVSPYITDIEYKQMKSKFHSMETQDDYNSLMEELETIAKKYSLKLK